MKSIIILVGMIFSGFLGAVFMSGTGNTNTEKTLDERVFEMAKLDEIRAKKNTRYHSFLNTSTLHCGVYHLKKGTKDTQSPHEQDEVYYVESGQAKIRIGEKDYECQAGSVIFVAAREKHFFFDIEEDLTLLVFFSKAKPDNQD